MSGKPEGGGGLKGVWHKIFDFRYFSWISVTQAPEYTIRAIFNFYKNSWRYFQFVLIAGVIDSGDMLFTPNNLSLVSL